MKNNDPKRDIESLLLKPLYYETIDTAMEKDLFKPYDLGYAAFLKGYSTDSNPFDRKTDSGEFVHGWSCARMDYLANGTAMTYPEDVFKGGVL